MTTIVTVKANHGWPVRVISKDKQIDGSFVDRAPIIVQAGKEQDFYVHSTMDLLIHEVLPDEVA